MTNSFSLHYIFNQAQCDFKIVDLSRRVVEISHEDFCAIEDNRVPYPFPIKQHAEIGIAFWKAQEAPWVWFLKIPLDERGLLTQKSLGDFISYVGQAISENAQNKHHQNEPTQKTQTSNPYIFTPQDDKKAIFHSLISVIVKKDCSQYYEKAKQYLLDQAGFEHWQNIGLQGFADICVRMEQTANASDLKCIQFALPNLPHPPQYVLLGWFRACNIAKAFGRAIRRYCSHLDFKQ